MIKTIKAEEYDDKAFLKMPNLHLLSDKDIEKINKSNCYNRYVYF